MIEDRRLGSFAIPLTAGVLLVLAATLAAGYAIEADCPNCRGEKELPVDLDDDWVRNHHLQPQPKAVFHLSVECTRCSGTGKTALLKAWMEGSPATPSP